MKMKLAILLLVVLMTGCKKELVKLEFTSSPTITETGNFNKSTVFINKTISKSDIRGRLDLSPEAELQSVKVKYAAALLSIDESTAMADSVRIFVYCDAIPGLDRYAGTLPVKKGTIAKDSNIPVPLFGVKLEAVNFINAALDAVIKTNKTINFRLEGFTIPGGSTISGTASLYVHFDVVYHKCIEAHEFLILTDAYKGTCE